MSALQEILASTPTIDAIRANRDKLKQCDRSREAQDFERMINELDQTIHLAKKSAGKVTFRIAGRLGRAQAQARAYTRRYEYVLH